MTHITITIYPPESVPRSTLLPPFRTPAAGKFARFKRDEELEKFDFNSRVVQKNYKHGALPATVPLDGKPDFMPLSREWQELQFDCLVWQAGGTMTHDQLIEAWKSATMHSRALNDQHAWDFPHEKNGVQYAGFHDYILGMNVDAGDVCQRGLSMAGNICEIMYGSTFKTLSLGLPAPKIETIWGNHALIWWATETDKPNWFDGGRINTTSRWPQLGTLGVPFLNISPLGTNTVSADRIASISNNSTFSPYT